MQYADAAATGLSYKRRLVVIGVLFFGLLAGPAAARLAAALPSAGAGPGAREQLPAIRPPAGAGPQSCVVAFYNVENLYDTVASPFYDDREFTPGGRYRWDSARYHAKLRAVARVIDDLSPDVIGLAEVENEAVVRDLVRCLRDDYCYLHRTSSDRRGIDLAVLYRGDRFFPGRVELFPSGYGREFFGVEGELVGEPVQFVFVHLPSKLNAAAVRAGAAGRLSACIDSLYRSDPSRPVLLAGDFNAQAGERVLGRFMAVSRGAHDRLCYVLARARRRGYGSYAYRGRWMLTDHIFADTSFRAGKGLQVRHAGIFVREYMLLPAESGYGAAAGFPCRTFLRGEYCGGASDHLPVFVVLETRRLGN